VLDPRGQLLRGCCRLRRLFDALVRPCSSRSATFGEAGERLKVAVDFLRAKGYKRIAIVSHGMGSRMTHYYLTRDLSAPVNAWVCIGWGNEDDDFRQVKLPVLDLYGENDLPPVLNGAKRRAASIKDYGDRGRSWRPRQIISSTTVRSNS